MEKIIVILLLSSIATLLAGLGTEIKSKEHKSACRIVGLILMVVCVICAMCFCSSVPEIENQIIHDYLNGNYTEKVEYHYERTTNGECVLKDSTITYKKIK